jgi:hypothetical protein
MGCGAETAPACLDRVVRRKRGRLLALDTKGKQLDNPNTQCKRDPD